jgi:hypothetical protein
MRSAFSLKIGYYGLTAQLGEGRGKGEGERWNAEGGIWNAEVGRWKAEFGKEKAEGGKVGSCDAGRMGR